MKGLERTQDWRAERYRRHAGFVAELGQAVLEWLAPGPGERILDLGCGDGALTARIAAAGATVVGVDAGPDMVAAARARGLDARVADALDLPFEAEFDAVFSNAALHWMRRPDAVIAGVARALKSGGRFVAEMGGHGNVAAITVALILALDRRGLDGAARIPWYFPSAADYGRRLEQAGFTVERIDLIPRPTPLPTDIEGWLETFAENFFKVLAPDQRPSAMAEVVAALEPCLRDEQGGWTADYVRLRFAARLAA